MDTKNTLELHVSFSFDWESDRSFNFENFLQGLEDNHADNFTFIAYSDNNYAGIISSDTGSYVDLMKIAKKYDVDLASHVL